MLRHEIENNLNEALNEYDESFKESVLSEAEKIADRLSNKDYESSLDIHYIIDQVMSEES